MSIEVLDPTHEEDAGEFVLARRLATLEGATIGFISNGKEGTRGFFDALSRQLMEEHAVASVVRLTKSNYSAPAGAAILEQAAGWDAVLAGVGD